MPLGLSGLPSKYSSGPLYLILSVQMETGVSNQAHLIESNGEI